MRMAVAVLIYSLALAIPCASVALAIPCAAADSDTLRGNVTKDDSVTRVARPKTDALNGSAQATTGASAAKLNASIQSGSFDLDAQRGRMPAGITEGMLQGWVQSPLSRQAGTEDPRVWQQDMDRFFAFGHVNRDAGPPLATGLGAGAEPPPGLHVFVRMGLCGSWDAGGDGHLRWAMLNRELHSQYLGQEWTAWQREVSNLVQQRMEGVPDCGAAAMHVAVVNGGAMESVTDYRQGERPMQHLGTNEALALKLQGTLCQMGTLPPFPSGSQSPNAHILIFVTRY
jgi:hypothetical protein